MSQELSPPPRTASADVPHRYVAGVDVAYAKGDAFAVAAAVVYDRQRHELLEVRTKRSCRVEPYRPGALWQREGPLALAALRSLRGPVDAVLCDAHGTAHPARFGLACWLAQRLPWPVIGCAKSRLLGSFPLLRAEAGAVAPLFIDGEVCGAVVRTRHGLRPVFVSPGGGVSIEAAVATVLASCNGFRIPEPLRFADHLARRELATLSAALHTGQ